MLIGAMIVSGCAADEPEPTPVPDVEQPPEEDMMELPDLGGREVTIAIENAYLPFNFVLLATGEAQGWDYDFVDEACARLNCTPVWIEFAWDTMIASVAEGQFDMAADGITITEERAQIVDFSDGYVATEQRLLVRIEEDRFSGPEEFAANPDYILAEQVGTTNYAVAEELVGADRIVTFDGFGEVVQSVVSGDVDGAIIDETAGLGYLGANKDQLKLIGDSLSSDALGFIFPKGSDLVEPFNMVIAEMIADGTMQEINLKWFGPTFTVDYPEIGPGAYAVTLGTEENPIKVLFVPSVDVDFMIESGDLVEQGLSDATGFVFEVSIPTSYAATLEEMCASPTDTIGFIPAMGYALANQLCGVEPGLAAVRRGWNVYWTQFIVPRDSPFQTLEDLDGAKWAYPSATSTSGFLYPSVVMDEVGITPGEQVETGGSHTQAVKAVYNGEVDFATTFFSPHLLPEGRWDPATDPPDVPDDVVDQCDEIDGDLVCGGYTVLDARFTLFGEAPDVVEKVRILALSPEIVNDTMSFAPEFPSDLRQAIIDGVTAFIEGDERCYESLCHESFYGWTGVGPIADENFDGIRLLLEAQGITLENIGG
jgi:phosphate/phosphite/phosphonate ABC transporter binding protein